jgi:hypothetical protein
MSSSTNEDDFLPSLYNIFSGKTDESLIKLVDETNSPQKMDDVKEEPTNLYNDIMKEILHKMTGEQKEYIKNLYNENNIKNN